jgi:hypothetical protein
MKTILIVLLPPMPHNPRCISALILIHWRKLAAVSSSRELMQCPCVALVLVLSVALVVLVRRQLLERKKSQHFHIPMRPKDRKERSTLSIITVSPK